MRTSIVIAALAATSALAVGARPAHAFCGFYVNGAGGNMYNDATEVVLMREGTRTVLSMENSYQGPPSDFAMVVPVPVVLQKENVKTLPKDVFEKIDTMGSPRLVEYWEQDPCYQPHYDREDDRAMASGASAGSGSGMAKPDDTTVKVEARFAVGEYEIVILSATEATGLETWLKGNGYQIPDNAAPLLKPYVASGSKFFVAKVDPSKVSFDKDGHAQLSPLRFYYDWDDFSLPIRLGLAASPGKQDLIVNILSPEGRFDVSNYKNVTIPTNIDVKPDVRNKFAEFYAALFDRTIEKNPGAIVTEYAWQSSSCDPCPGPTIDPSDLATLGADVLEGGPGQATAYTGYDMTLTRLHARYGKDQVPDDLQFAKAKPIVGGREFVVDEKTGKLEEGSREDQYQNNFQGRYAIRHEWTGPIECANPQRHIWGGPPADQSYAGVQGGKDLAHAPRGNLQIAAEVKRDVPEIDVKAMGAGADAVPPKWLGNEPAGSPAPHHEGCCDTGGSRGAGGSALLLLGVAALLRRRP